MYLLAIESEALEKMNLKIMLSLVYLLAIESEALEKMNLKIMLIYR